LTPPKEISGTIGERFNCRSGFGGEATFSRAEDGSSLGPLVV
jgi:hypothetical protein